MMSVNVPRKDKKIESSARASVYTNHVVPISRIVFLICGGKMSQNISYVTLCRFASDLAHVEHGLISLVTS